MSFLKLTAWLAFSVYFSGLAVGQHMIQTTLDALIDEALTNNPKIHAALHEADASKARISQQGAWEPPQFGVELFQMPLRSFPVPIKGNMETDYFVQQTIPWPGKTSSMQEVARRSAKMRIEEVTALENEIVRQVKKAAFELLFLQRQSEINRKQRISLEHVRDVALQRYRVGLAGQSDVLRIQTEQSRLFNDSLRYAKETAEVESMLAALLGRSPLQPVGTISLSALPEMPANYDSLVILAQSNRPEVRAMETYTAMYKAERSAARLAYFPDFMVRGMYKDMSKTSKDFWSLMISVNLPLSFWSKDNFRSKVIEFDSHIRHAEMESLNMRNMVAADVHRHYQAVRLGILSVRNYEESLLPQARQSFEIGLTEYQTGRTSLAMVLENYQMVLETEMDYTMALTAVWISIANLEQALGLSLDEIRSGHRGQTGRKNHHD